MKRLAVLAITVALVALGILVLLGTSSPRPARAQPSQIGLTASYSVVDGSGSGVFDYISYISDGIQENVQLTSTPTVYLMDPGTPWSTLSVLTDSNTTERWITSQDVSGTITSPLTVSFTYYNQYSVNFQFGINGTDPGMAYSAPVVGFTQMGSPATAPANGAVWVDASSPFSYPNQLPGSSTQEEWVLKPGNLGLGIANKSATFSQTYFHEYYIMSSYSVVDGGTPNPPALESLLFGVQTQTTMSVSSQGVWADAGSPYSVTPTLTASAQSVNETWDGTVIVSTKTGTALSTDTNGTVTGPIDITPVYYHEYHTKVVFDYVGGTPTGLTLPRFTYEHFGTQTYVNTTSLIWADSGTQYTVPPSLCCVNSPDAERWVLYNATMGDIDLPTMVVSSTYFHQYFESFSYSIAGAQPPPPFNPPTITYMAAGNGQQLTLLTTAQTAWADAASTYTATASLPASTGVERWYAVNATGKIVGPAPNNSIDLAYQQQYLLTIIGGGLRSQWVNAGTNTTLNTAAVYDRQQGTGYRVIAYQLDSQSTVTLATPVENLTFSISMTGPHSITFKSVSQFQVTLDHGAAAALNYITPPTIPGDGYWYDQATPVQVVLNGVYGRADGVGFRLASVTATGLGGTSVDTRGEVDAYSTASLGTPISITTTSVNQYEVVLNSAANAAFVSISPDSTFAGDTFWYDSGSPAVTVVLNGIYSRADGTGFRTTSWELDTEGANKVAQLGTITIVTKPMNAAQFINATSVTQYQVTMDKGGQAALVSITGTPIPSDTGWYDASTPVGVIMNGVWARSGGTGQRLAGYSINAGTEVAVASTGQVAVLNVTELSSPEAITTSVVTQYQVTLDSGATQSLSSTTPTPVPKDAYWYDAGSPVSVTLEGVWGRTATTGSRLASYTVDNGASTAVLSSTAVKVLSLSAISRPESIATKVVLQYHLTSSPATWTSLTNSTLPGDAPAWFDSGTSVKAVFSYIWNTTDGTREIVSSYTVDGTGKTNVPASKTGAFTVTLTMDQAHSISLTSTTQYLLAVLGGPTVTANPPSQTGDMYFNAGSKVAFTVPRIWNATDGDSAARDVLTSYAVNGAKFAVPQSSTATTFTTETVTFSKPQILVFSSLSEYLVNFQFFDSKGVQAVDPSQVQLGVGNSTVTLQGSSMWFANGTSFSVADVTWEGASVGPTPAPSYVVKSAPLNVTLDTQVYTASLKVVDALGFPVAGAHVSMSLANGTTITGTTRANGTFTASQIPLGTFTAKVTSFGMSTTIVGDPAAGQAVAEGKVPFGVISLFAMVGGVAAIGSGSTLLLRKRKRGKPKS